MRDSCGGDPAGPCCCTPCLGCGSCAPVPISQLSLRACASAVPPAALLFLPFSSQSQYRVVPEAKGALRER